jgi:hypothetical protein
LTSSSNDAQGYGPTNESNFKPAADAARQRESAPNFFANIRQAEGMQERQTTEQVFKVLGRTEKTAMLVLKGRQQ